MKRLFRKDFLIFLLMTLAVTIFGLRFGAYHSLAATGTAIAGNFTTFSGTLAWVQGTGYFLMFVAMVIEGPIITSAAAFASALGYFNIFAVFGLSILGDLVGDFAYYAMGYFGRVALVERYGAKVGLTKERIDKMERLLKEHPGKMLTAIKLAPVIPAPGLMLVGATKMQPAKYTWMTLIVTVPKTIVFMVLGYYFGEAYDSLSTSFSHGEYFIIGAVIIAVLAYYAYKKIAAKISNNLETF